MTKLLPRAWPALALALAVTVALPQFAHAQEDLPFAFAYRLGSGVYAAGGRSIQIYRLPFSATILKHEGRDFGVELSLPATLGFYDFQARDVLDEGLPESVGTATFTPGVRNPITVLANWILTPFAEGGPGAESETHTTTWVYGAGVESVATVSSGPGAFRLGQTLVYVGENPEGAPRRSFIELDLGLEYRLPVGWRMRGKEIDFGGYAQSFRYWHDEEEIAAYAAAATRTLVAQWEVGFTFGTVQRSKLWKVPIPRVGIGYRFGEYEAAWRLAFGSPF